MTNEEYIRWLKLLDDELPFDNLVDGKDEMDMHEMIFDLCEKLEQEPCEDAISRQAVLNAIIKELYIKVENYLLQSKKTIYDVVKNMPSVKPQEPKIGHWIAQDIHNCHTDFKCSECGYIYSFMHLYGKPTADYTYCPNCGCRMESNIWLECSDVGQDL